jgi:FkbM family methyltransferase
MRSKRDYGSELSKAWALLSGVSNPVPAVLDRLRWRQAPYTLHLRNGAVVELRPQMGDLFGFYEIMLRMDYLGSGQQLGLGATVIDVGANIGCFTIVASRIVGPSGRVIAIEPEESTYQQLLRNIELNQLTNVTPIKMAVGASQGTITLHSHPNRLFSSVFSSVNGREVRGTDQQVPVTTLDELMNVHSISTCDYLKLDCEGAEHHIVGSMSLNTAQRIEQITMEVHKVAGFDGHELMANLERLGYRRIGDSTLPYYARANSDRGQDHVPDGQRS